MKLEILVDDLAIEHNINNLPEFRAHWSTLHDMWTNQEKLIHCVIIDGQEFYDGYDVEIMNRFHSIGTIHIKTISKEETIALTVNEIREYNQKLLLKLDDISDPFYGEIRPADWDLFASFIQGVDWLYKSIGLVKEMIVQTSLNKENERYIEKLLDNVKAQVSQLEAAIQSNDYVTAGDTIKYEFETICKEIDRVFGELQ